MVALICAGVGNLLSLPTQSGCPLPSKIMGVIVEMHISRPKTLWGVPHRRQSQQRPSDRRLAGVRYLR